jgi:hypothetical protein
MASAHRGRVELAGDPGVDEVLVVVVGAPEY